MVEKLEEIRIKLTRAREAEVQRNLIHDPEDHHVSREDRVNKPIRFRDFLEL